MLRRVAAAIFVAVVATAAIAADGDVKAPKLGTPLSVDEIAKWDRTIFADGRGLPPGKGSAKDGRVIYEQKCASCHGSHGEGNTAEELVSELKPPSGDYPSKAIGSYWPFAPTIFDFVRRSMPPAAAGSSLTADETYALTAYLLAANGVIGEVDEMNAKTLAAVHMPNRDGFIWIDVKK